MAIRGPKGPHREAKGPQNQDPGEKAAELKKQSATAHTQPTSDEFDRIAESMAGSDFDQSDSAKRRKRGNIQRRRAIYSRTVTRIGDDLQKFQREAAQILSVLAAQTFSSAAIERHKKELARIRKRIARAYRHILASHRADREKALGLDQIEESKLARVEETLEKLNRFETQWGKAMAAIEMSCEAAEGGEPRRLNMAGADFEKARNYAAISNPNTVAIDLATSALMFLEAKEPASKSETPKNKLGRSLDGQQALEQVIAPVSEEK